MTPTQPPQGVMAELRELLARATPGPWVQECAVSDSGGWKMPEQRVTIRSPLWTVAHYSTAFDEFPVEDENAANAALIVAAVNALPGLLDEVEALRAEAVRHEELGIELIHARNAAESRASALLARCEGLEAALMVLCDVAELAEPESRYDLAVPIREARSLLAATRTTGD